MSCDEHESVLLARAAAFSKCPGLALLNAEQLQTVAASEGIDFATAVLYDRVRRSDRFAAFIARIDELQKRDRKKAYSRRATIAIVPAAFYKEKPYSGADGRVVREAAARMGLYCELVPLHSTGTLDQNSTILLDWLKQHNSEKLILVSLCKGGADVRVALDAPAAGTRFGNVQAWVNICGTLNGSPVAQWLLATKPRSFAIWMFLKSGGHDFQFLRELATSSSGPLSGPLRILPGMQLITIVGFPLRRHLANGFMRRCHKVLCPRGPNDGGMVLADVCRMPGLVYPVWGADHYLRPDERAQRIITAVLDFLVSEPARAGMVHSREEPRRAT
jgi:hypothetical protein